MKNTKYDKLKIQDYFQNSKLSVENKRDMFAFRTRMAEFGENYRGQREYVICPYLCNKRDSQQHSFECKGVTNQITVNGTYSDIFNSEIPITTCYTVTKIRKIRNVLLEETNISVYSNENQNQNRKRKRY